MCCKILIQAMTIAIRSQIRSSCLIRKREYLEPTNCTPQVKFKCVVQLFAVVSLMQNLSYFGFAYQQANSQKASIFLLTKCLHKGSLSLQVDKLRLQRPSLYIHQSGLKWIQNLVLSEMLPYVKHDRLFFNCNLFFNNFVSVNSYQSLQSLLSSVSALQNSQCLKNASSNDVSALLMQFCSTPAVLIRIYDISLKNCDYYFLTNRSFSSLQSML